MFHGHVQVCHRLRLYPLCGINKKKNAFTGCKGAGNLVRKIDMTWRIDKIEEIYFTIFRPVGEGDCLAFYGDSPFTLDIHIIQDLVFENPVGNYPCVLNHTIGEGRLSMVDMGYYAEITYIFHN